MATDTVIQFRGTIYEKGYGLIAQKVMRDRDLSPTAKSIYAYICSFAAVGEDGERSAFPGVPLMMEELGIKTKDTYYKHRKQLLDKGYISIEKNRKSGQFDNNIYYIEAVPKPQNVDTEGFRPCPKNSTTVNSTTENKDANSISSNSISSNNISNTENLNPNPEIDDVYEVLYHANIPQSLKHRIKVMIADKNISLTARMILDIESAYFYQIQKSYVIPNCDIDYSGALNDFEFSNTVFKMLETVKDIRNMRGLIQEWVQLAFEHKVERLS